MNRQEAIDIVKKNWPDSSFSLLKEALEFLIPELVKTDDEKIKEAIIKGIIHAAEEGCFCADNYSAKECIDWIEKQDLHSNFLQTIQVGDQVTRNKDGILVNLSQLKRVAKPADETERQGEQKPAWSEEDEMFVHGLIRGLAAKRDIHGHTTFSSDCIDITKTIDWLNSLKDRVLPQQQPEWREEMIEKAVNYLDGIIFNYLTVEHANVDTFIDFDNIKFIEDFKKVLEEK